MEKNNLNSTEVSLPKETEFLEQVINNAQVAIVITDNYHKIEYVNPEFTRIFGYTEEEAIGKHTYDLIVPEEFRIELEQLNERLEKWERSEYETIRCTKDGQRIHVIIRVSPIIIDGKRIGGFGFFSDISEEKHTQEELQKAHEELEMRVEKRTEELKKANEKLETEIRERKRIEKALSESEEGYRTVIESCNDGVSIIKGKRHLYVNQKFADIHGYESPQEVIGKSLDEFVHPDDLQWVQDLAIRRQKGEPVANKYEFKALQKDGTAVYLENSVTKTIYHGKSVSLSYLRDITDRKRAEEEKIRLETQLLQAQKMEAIGTLAGGIAHNFNNLLMSIQGNTSLMLLDTPSDHPHYERLTTIEQLVQSGSKLTSQLLGYARGGSYEVKPININRIMTDTSATFAMTRKDITIKHDLATTLAGVKADRSQIEQVVLNIYVNAAEAMPKGGELCITTRNIPHTQITGKSYTIKPGNYILLTIKDTGIGMDKHTQAKVFDPFFTTKGLAKGTGLGLASVYGIIKAHGGYIDVESKKGKGTTFSIYLPASEETIGEEIHPAGTIETGKETILLVDDEEIILDVGEALLTSLGYTVLIAHGGHEAIAILRTSLPSSPPDLVILDMIMPGMGGGETYDRMKELSPTIKVLLSSGYSIDGQATEILKRGCDGFLQKPFTMKELSKAIQEVVGEG
jgi:two-component system cell cycle sensor histidine kinase/response regulator CckA